MKYKSALKILFSLSLIAGLSSCESNSQSTEHSGTESSGIESSTEISVEDSLQCPDSPSGTLENPEVIDISDQRLQKNGVVTPGNDIGFTFVGQEGQRINYSYNDQLCVWIYTPDNTLLEGVELPRNGTYTIQVASLRGTTTFDIEMSLSNPVVSTPSPANQPETSSTATASRPRRTPQPTPTPTQTPSQPSTSSNRATPRPTSSSDLTQSQAVSLVDGWLDSKSNIFAHPFDQSLARRYTYTDGPLYYDITKPGGSIDWLRSNNSYYNYGNTSITEIISFSVSGSRPELIVTIYEETTLNTPTGVDRSSSASGSRRYSYSFFKENGSWKIFDYRRL